MGGGLNTTMSTGGLVVPALSSTVRRRGRGNVALELTRATSSDVAGTLGNSNAVAGACDLPSATRRYSRLKICAASAFTLIEIMVVILLLTVIVLGLMAMFDETQRAFRAGMAQTDVMEGGRMFNDQISRELEQITPSYENNGLNFFAEVPYNYTPLPEALPGDTIPRTNLLHDLFFITKVNQTWNGIGYYVRTNFGYGGYSTVDPVGTLYRYETNIPVTPFNAGGASNAFQSFITATNPANLSKILDGVVEFKVRCYDTNGNLLSGDSFVTNNFLNISNVQPNPPWPPNEMSFYAFSNNIVPAFVEVELGVLEPAILKRYNSIPDIAARYNFLSNHAGNVEIFRQRIAVRNVDASAYTTNYTPPPF